MNKVMAQNITRGISFGVLALTFATGCVSVHDGGGPPSCIDVEKPYETLDATIRGYYIIRMKFPRDVIDAVRRELEGCVFFPEYFGGIEEMCEDGDMILFGIKRNNRRSASIDAFVIGVDYRDGRREEAIFQWKGNDKFCTGQEVTVWQQGDTRCVRPKSQQVTVIQKVAQ